MKKKAACDLWRARKRQALVLIAGSEGQLAIGFFSLSLEWIDGNLGSSLASKEQRAAVKV